MTKRVMTKKFMKETGTDKKTAMEYLRKCQWNYGTAKTLYYAPATLAEFADRIASIDWTEVIEKVVEAVKATTEKIIELVQSEEFQTACNAVASMGKDSAKMLAPSEVDKLPEATFGDSFHGELWMRCPHCNKGVEMYGMTGKHVASSGKYKAYICPHCNGLFKDA